MNLLRRFLARLLLRGVHKDGQLTKVSRRKLLGYTCRSLVRMAFRGYGGELMRG